MPTDRRHPVRRDFYIRRGTVRRNASGHALDAHSRALFDRILGRFTMRVARALVCLGALGGCSVSMPMASLIQKPHDDETGVTAQSKLVGWLDREDWNYAKMAFSRALDAEKTGAATTWDNPTSGTKGTFVAVGQAYPGAGGLCRAFRADIARQAADHALEGTACAGKSGEWQVTEVKPSNKV